jgi:hypothetical protein
MEGLNGEMSSIAPGGGLDQFGQPPVGDTQLCVGGLPGRGDGVLVPAQPVVEQRFRPLRDAQPGPLAARHDRIPAGGDRRLGLAVVPPPRRQSKGMVRREVRAGRLPHHLDLIDECGGRRKLAGEEVEEQAHVQGEEKVVEGAGLPGGLHVAGGDDVPALVVPETGSNG